MMGFTDRGKLEVFVMPRQEEINESGGKLALATINLHTAVTRVQNYELKITLESRAAKTAQSILDFAEDDLLCVDAAVCPLKIGAVIRHDLKPMLPGTRRARTPPEPTHTFPSQSRTMA